MRVALALLAISSLTSPLLAQSPEAGRLTGTVSGKASRAGARAAVEATRVSPEPVLSFRTTVDANGRYRFDALPAGAYELHVSTLRLDSLGLYVPDRAVTIDA
ncbi:MAG TPA: carboxypeptidase-like regulatory domain-containing protein, partial [Gemmatimonadaceae bacterium]|nr:carboxypeptidase-like regulatory domain-containing protein [Gemmatimonadaceae bacterium]